MAAILLTACGTSPTVPGNGGTGANAAYPRFAYVVGDGQRGGIGIFAVDAASGQLRHDGYALTGSYPAAVVPSPSGAYLYLVSNGDYAVVSYAIDAATGQLSELDSIGTGRNPLAGVIDPSGRFLYVANYDDDTISAFTVDPSAGTFTGVPPLPRAGGRTPWRWTRSAASCLSPTTSTTPSRRTLSTAPPAP